MKKQSIGKSILYNTFYLMIAEIIVRIITFLTVAYLARIVGVSHFGRLEFSFAVLSYFSIFAILGLNTIGNKEISIDREKSSVLLSNILVIQFLSAVVSGGLFFLFSLYSGKDEATRLLLTLQILNILGTVFGIEWFFIGMKEMIHVGINRVVRQIIYFLAIIIFVRSASDFMLVPLLYFAASFGGIFYLWFVLLHQEKIRFKPQLDFLMWKDLLKQSLPIMGSYLLTKAYYNIDIVFLGLIKTDEQVGLYSGAYKIINLLMGVKLIMSGVLFPFLSQLYNESQEKLNYLVNFTEKMSFVVIIPITFGVIILAKEIVKFIYHSGFQEAVSPLRILIFVAAFEFFNMIFPTLLNATGKQKSYLKVVAVVNIVSIVLYLILIPKFEMYGAAIVSAGSSLISFLWCYFEAKKVARVDLERYIFIPVLASIVMSIAIINILWSLFARIMLGAVIYFVLIFIFRYFSLSEFLFIKKKIQIR